MFVKGLDAICNDLGGPLIVALFYWFRFHTLKGTRSYTTKFLFAFGVITFITPFLVIYAMLPQKMSPLAGIWLLIFIWLVPVVPTAWRSFCHGLAGIPFRALDLRNVLASSSFELRPDDIPALRRKLGRIGYQTDDFRAVQSTAIQSRFLKISAIVLHLEQWSARGEGFIDRNSEQYADLLCVFDALSFRTVRVLKNSAEIYGAMIEESKVEPDDWHALDSLATRSTPISQLQLAARTAAGSMLEDLRKDMDSLLNNLLLFVARATLSGEWNFAGRKRRLEAMGFAINSPPPDIMRTVAIATAVTVGWSLVWLLAFSKSFHIEQHATMRTVVVSPMYFVVNFWLVNYFRQHYAFANEDLFGRMPGGFVVSVGLCSAVLIFPVQAYFDFIQFPDRPFPQVLLHDLPLLILPWGIGAMTALLIQDSVWDGFKSDRAKRVMDGALFATGLTLLVLLLLAVHKILHVPAMETVDHASARAFVAGVLVSTFAFGFVIGYLVMARLREISSRYPADNKLISRPALASA